MKKVNEVAELCRVTDVRTVKSVFGDAIVDSDFIPDAALMDKFGFVPDEPFMALEEAKEYLGRSASLLAQKGVIPFFQLTNRQGSRKLFLKRDLDNVKKVLIKYNNRSYAISYSYERSIDLLRHVLNGGYFDEKSIDVLNAYLICGKPIEEIAESNGLTISAMREYINKQLYRLWRRGRQADRISEVIAQVRKENAQLEAENNRLLQIINQSGELKQIELAGRVIPEKVYEVYKKMEQDFSYVDLSARAYNCLKAAKINNFIELCCFVPRDLLKFRNFGKKSFDEIEVLFYRETGIYLHRFMLGKEVTIDMLNRLMTEPSN